MTQADPQPLFGDISSHDQGDPAPAGGGEQLDAAFGRLDAALSRLERAATLKRPNDRELSHLRLEHAALRASIGDALQQLDGVLADLQGNA